MPISWYLGPLLTIKEITEKGKDKIVETLFVAFCNIALHFDKIFSRV